MHHAHNLAVILALAAILSPVLLTSGVQAASTPVVITTVSSFYGPVGDNYQRQVSYANGAWYVQLCTGAYTALYYSVDGSTWTSAGNAAESNRGYKDSVWSNGQHIYLAQASATNTAVRVYAGTVNADHTIKWSGAVDVPTVKEYNSCPSISTDANGIPWIVQRSSSGSSYFFGIYQGNGIVPTSYTQRALFGPYTLVSNDQGASIYGLDDGRVVALWDGNRELHAAIYSGGTWGSTVTLSTTAVSRWSAAVDGDRIYATWTDGTTIYLREHDGTAWRAAEAVTTAASVANVQISIGSGFQAIYYSDGAYLNASYRFAPGDVTAPRSVITESSAITDVSVSVGSVDGKIMVAYDLASTKAVKAFLDPTPSAWRPSWTTNPPTSMILGASYSYTPALNESATITAPTLPAWLTLGSNGTLYGTPSAVGNYPVVLRATSDAGGLSAFQSFIISVGSWAPGWLHTPSYLAMAEAPYTFDAALNESAQLTALAIPSWLTLDGTVLTGTPQTADIGVHSVSLMASGGPGGAVSYLNWTITVKERGRWMPLVSSTPGTSLEVAQGYSYTVAANESVTISYSGPSWLQLSGMTISGIAPTSPQTVHVSLKITSVAGTLSVWQNWTINVWANPPVIPNPPEHTVIKAGDEYHYGFGGSGWGSSGDLRLSIDDPPEWLNYDPINGTISGTPTGPPGDYYINATVTNTTTGLSTDVIIPIHVDADPPEIVGGDGRHDIPGNSTGGSGGGPSLPVDIVIIATPYSYTVSVDPDRCTVTMVTGPSWLQWSAENKTAWGTPMALGDYPVSLRVYDPLTKLVIWDNYTIRVTAVPPVITTTASSNGLVNLPWSYTVVYYPADALVTLDGMPDWMTYDNATRTLSGIPDAGAVHVIHITVTNATSGMSATQTLTVRIELDAPELICNPPRTGQERVLYRWTAAADQPVVWSISGDAGTWLTIDPATGRVQGTPDAAGIYTITVTGTNERGVSSSYTYELTIKPYSTGGSSGNSSGGGSIILPGGIEIPGVGGTVSYSTSIEGPVIAIVCIAVVLLFALFRRREG